IVRTGTLRLSPPEMSLTCGINKRMSSDTPAPGSIMPERVVARVRPHGRRLIPSVILFVGVVGITPYALGLDSLEPWRLAIAIGAGVLVFTCVVLPYLAWLGTRTAITTRRIVVRRGVFVRERRERLHRRRQYLTARRTPLQMVLGAGDVRVIRSADYPLVVKDVPQPILLQSALHELVESALSGASATSATGIAPVFGSSNRDR